MCNFIKVTSDVTWTQLISCIVNVSTMLCCCCSWFFFFWVLFIMIYYYFKLLMSILCFPKNKNVYFMLWLPAKLNGPVGGPWGAEHCEEPNGIQNRRILWNGWIWQNKMVMKNFNILFSSFIICSHSVYINCILGGILLALLYLTLKFEGWRTKRRLSNLASTSPILLETFLYFRC